jgi:uncharacterized damage-inducible protein DinB
MTNHRSLTITLFLALSTCALFAQAKPSAEPQTVTSVMDQRLSQVEKEFVDAADAMPDDKFTFVPTSGEFKGVRNFGQQVKHVASSNYFFAATMLQEKAPAAMGDGENGPAEINGKADIIKYLKDSFAYTHKAYAALNDKNAVEPIKNPFGEKPWTRLGVATLEVGHVFDHYGQMVEYLRMNGIVPPASRPQR